jgi:cell division ATPase FtsA
MFFKKENSKEVTLIVDIGSSSVGAALVSISKGTSPQILWSNRLPVVLKNDVSKPDSLIAVTSTLETVMAAAAAKHITASKTHIILSSPWYISKTKSVKFENDLPAPVTRHSIEKLEKDARAEFIQESKSDGEVVEHRVIRTKLNGYNTPDPYNKKAKSVEVTFFVSIVPKAVLETILRVVKKHFQTENNEISSFSLVAWSTIASILPAENDFLVVDVRGEVTDLSLGIDDALLKSSAFPQGKNALIKAISTGSGQTTAASLSLLNTALKGDTDATVKSDLVKVSETFKRTWSESYVKNLQAISTEAKLNIVPQTIFLMSDPDVEPFFENILNETKKTGKLHLLKHLNVNNYIEPTSVPTDPFLALESIFVTII